MTNCELQRLVYKPENGLDQDRAMMEGATPLLAAALQGHTKATANGPKHHRLLVKYSSDLFLGQHYTCPNVFRTVSWSIHCRASCEILCS